MSFIIKGIDMPKENEYWILTVWGDGSVYGRTVETSDARAIQIPVQINTSNALKVSEKGESMTIEGAIAELQNLIKADDVPFYYNGVIQKVIETILDECTPKVGAWIDDEEYNMRYGYYFAHCSECDYQMDVHENRGYHNYCPHCGAKMEGSE